MKCAILGAGSRGTALAQVLAKNGHQPCLRSINQEDCTRILQERENPSYLPWCLLDENISCETRLKKVLEDSDLIVIALPSKALPSCLKQLHSLYQGQPLVLASKGRNASDFSPLSTLITKTLGDVPLAVLSGASHAEEVVKGIPTGVVIASSELALAEQIRGFFQNEVFKCCLSSDMIWVQLMGAFKNLVALACGMSDGLGYGVNTKALIFTKGLQETAEIWLLLGAQRETMLSCAGVADMYVTCSSALSRNWNAGRLLAEGHSKQEITWGLMKMIAEGLYMTDAVEFFLSSHELSLPLLKMIVEVVNQQVPCASAFEKFLKHC